MNVKTQRNGKNIDMSMFFPFLCGGECGSRTHHQSFADSCLTAWLTRRIKFFGAGNENRTRD